jgi:hypothetical protein
MANEQTKQVIAEMLKENTGRHFLDSGGAYGRNWERNQTREFDGEPYAKLEASVYRADEDGENGELELLTTLNVYHWLCERLEYDEALQTAFEAFADKPENEDSPWLATAEAFVESLKAQGYELGGIYGEGEPMTVNTYNNEDALSQTLQYVYFTLDASNVETDEDGNMPDGFAPFSDGEYVLLQIHGGCDVRGGYTKPRAFTCGHYGELDILDNARVYLTCENPSHATRHQWYSDDAGSHFYDETWPKPVENAPRSLSEWPIKQVSEAPQTIDGEMQPSLPDVPKRNDIIGYVAVDEDHNAYCPYCGHKLIAG